MVEYSSNWNFDWNGIKNPATYQPLVSREENGIQHRFIEKAITHPLADDYIDLGKSVGKLHFLHFTFDESDS